MVCAGAKSSVQNDSEQMTPTHYKTILSVNAKLELSVPLFDAIVVKYRDRFVCESFGSTRVFGSICVPITGGWITTPREKGEAFTGNDAVVVSGVERNLVYVVSTGMKATLNAPLMIRMCVAYPKAMAVLHLHERLRDIPTTPYAHPGTMADGNRVIPGPVFNIENHGFIACLDDNLEVWRNGQVN